MTLPRYPEYKNSGVAWLGEVPGHWEVKQGRRLYSQKRDSALPSDEQLSATQKYGVVPQRMFMEMEDQKVTLALSGLDNFKHVEKDDFVISLRSFQGGIERSKYSGCVSPAYTVLRPACQIEAGFMSYLLKSAGYIAALQTVTDGIRDGKNISYEQFGQIGLPFPVFAEQQTIAAFLDRETGKIDALIAEQQRLVGLLAEKRQAVISHAVTKGLNLNARMKDSGITWLGEVPEHWVVKKLGFLCDKIGSGKTPLGGAEIYTDSGVLFLRSQNVYDEGLHLDDVVYVSEEIDAEMPWSRVRPGDILLNITGASLGRSCLVPNDFQPANVNQHVCVIRLLDASLQNYVAMVMKSSCTKSQMDTAQTGAAREGLNYGQISKLIFAVPPIDERQKIAAFLDTETAKFDTLTAEANRAIELLQERRSALISAAVTGKIDVRQAV